MRGTAVAKGVREGSVGSPELQLMLKEKCYGLNFRVLLLKTKPNQLQKSKTRRELTIFAIRLRGAPAVLDGHPRLAPGGKREPLHTAGDTRDTAPARQECTRAGSSGATLTSAIARGLIALPSPAALGVWLPALCKTLEIPINCCY